MLPPSTRSLLFFFNDTATTEIYTLSLHDALPICEYFLGAIVVSPNENDPKVMEIVDGQQRLAALSMIFAAIIQEWKKRSEEHTSELQSRLHLVCRLLLEKKK